MPIVGLSTLSSHMNVDFSRFPLHTPVADIAVQGMQGIFSIIKELSRRDGLTLADVGRLYGEGMLVPQIVGTPAQVVEQLVEPFRQRGDGAVAGAATGCCKRSSPFRELRATHQSEPGFSHK